MYVNANVNVYVNVDVCGICIMIMILPEDDPFVAKSHSWFLAAAALESSASLERPARPSFPQNGPAKVRISWVFRQE